MSQGSISSMTGNSRIAQGPSMVVTCRADKDTANQLMKVSKSSDLDISKYELVLSPCPKRQKVDAYPRSCTKDFSQNYTNVSRTDVSAQIPDLGHRIKYVDQSMESYYRDLYDARNEFEYVLAKNQISLHSCPQKEGLVEGAENQDTGPTLDIYSGFLSPATSSDAQNCRRFPIFFSTSDVALTAAHTELLAYERVPVPGYENIVHLQKSTDGSFSTEKHIGNTSMACFVFYTDGVDDVGFTLRSFIDDYFDQVSGPVQSSNGFAWNRPYVFTPKNPTTSPITPMDFHFQGFALGAAHIDVRDGDNVFSSLRSGAITVRNGPFQLNAGDNLIWLRKAEIICFDSDGTRKIRPVLDENKLTKFFAATPTPEITADDQRYQTFKNTKDVKTLPRDPTGDGSPLVGFTFAPLKYAFASMTKTKSFLDHSRRIGTALSNGAGSSMVDVLVGSDI